MKKEKQKKRKAQPSCHCSFFLDWPSPNWLQEQKWTLPSAQNQQNKVAQGQETKARQTKKSGCLHVTQTQVPDKKESHSLGNHGRIKVSCTPMFALWVTIQYPHQMLPADPVTLSTLLSDIWNHLNTIFVADDWCWALACRGVQQRNY